MRRILALLATLTALAALAAPARAADYDVSGATEVTAEVSDVTLAEAREATKSKSVVEREHRYGVIQHLTGRDERPQGHAEALRQHFGERQQYDGVVAGWDDAGSDPPDGDGGGGLADDPPPDESDPPDVPTGGGGGGDDGDDWTLVHTSSGSQDGHSFKTDTYKNENGVFKDVTTWTDPDGNETTTTTCYTTDRHARVPRRAPVRR